LKEGRRNKIMMKEEKRKKDLKNKRRNKHWTSFLNPKHDTGVPSPIPCLSPAGHPAPLFPKTRLVG
jgi:hypothetical protein